MLNKVKTARERWGGVSQAIDRWLQDRQDLLVLFLGLTSKDDSLTLPEREAKLQEFCQILVDYVSAGHFEIYEQLVQEARERDDKAGLQEARAKYTTVDGTTEEILDFNDKYQETDDLSSLTADLSTLGVCLETRFEAEDYMLDILHIRYQDSVSQ